HVPFDSDQVLSVFPRARFDAALLNDAKSAGADHIAGRVLAVDRDASGWMVTTTGGSIGASWLLGADGASGVVRKRVFRRFHRRQLSIAAGSFVDDVSVPEIVVRFVDRPRASCTRSSTPGSMRIRWRRVAGAVDTRGRFHRCRLPISTPSVRPAIGG